MKITTAVIPAAGLGTRFLPWTISMPKEMLPIVDKPVIQFVVEECYKSGIKEVIIVINKEKKAIADYFTPDSKLQDFLRKYGKVERIKELEELCSHVKISFVYQSGPYGNATPVIDSEKIIAGRPFAVLWGDQFIWADPPRLKQCLDIAQIYNSSVIAGIEVDDTILTSRGMCDLSLLKDNIYSLKRIVEKPKIKETPSRIAAYGTYVFKPTIFKYLKSLKPGKDNEYWLVDAINLLAEKEKVLVCLLKNAAFYDAGTKINYCKTFVDFMLKDREVGNLMLKYLRKKTA